MRSSGDCGKDTLCLACAIGVSCRLGRSGGEMLYGGGFGIVSVITWHVTLRQGS